MTDTTPAGDTRDTGGDGTTGRQLAAWRRHVTGIAGRAATVFVASFGAETGMLYVWYMFILLGRSSGRMESFLVTGPVYALLPLPALFFFLLFLRIRERNGGEAQSLTLKLLVPGLAYFALVTLFFAWPLLPGFREITSYVRIDPFLFTKMMRLKWLALLFIWLWWCDGFRFRPDTVLLCLLAFSVYFVIWRYLNGVGFVLRRQPERLAGAVMQILDVRGQAVRLTLALRGKMFAVAVYAFVSLCVTMRRRVARYGRQSLRELWSNHFGEWK